MTDFSGFARPYFDDAPWEDRVAEYERINGGVFVGPNRETIERIISSDRTSLRIVVNSRAAGLLGFLKSGRYDNAYDRAEIGDRAVSPIRNRADSRVGAGPDTYFAALSIGGPGVRYYGDYCMVLEVDIGELRQPRLFDRDSYDTLFAPLAAIDDSEIERLGGSWDEALAMVLMRVLPRMDHDQQIVTSGTVTELVLTDQEFIEVHLPSSFSPADLAQVVEAPDMVAIESRLREQRRRGAAHALHELEWLRRRSAVDAALHDAGVRHRVVTDNGRGYQWV